MKIFVIARDGRQFSHWKSRFALDENEYIYIHDPEQLFGIQENAGFMTIGANKNILKLVKILRLRGCIEIEPEFEQV